MAKSKYTCKCGNLFYNNSWEDFRHCRKCRKRMTNAGDGINHANFGQSGGRQVIKRKR